MSTRQQDVPSTAAAGSSSVPAGRVGVVWFLPVLCGLVMIPQG